MRNWTSLAAAISTVLLSAVSAQASTQGSTASANFHVTIPGTSQCSGGVGGSGCSAAGVIDVPHLGNSDYVYSVVHVTGFPYSFDPSTGVWTARQSTSIVVTFTNARGTLTLSGLHECVSTAPAQDLVTACDSSLTTWTASGTDGYANYSGSGGFGGAVTLGEPVTFVGHIDSAAPPHAL